MKTLYLIDVSGFIFRAFYALPPLTRADKTPVGAVYGFCNMLLRLRDVILERSPATEEVLWAGVFDVARINFRHEIDPLYKSNRGEMPPELEPQFALIREACQAFGCPVCEAPGFEADDVIASYTKLALGQGLSVVIVSSDKDLMQLYQKGVEIYDPMKNKWIQLSDIDAKFGVPPERIPDVQALMGDSSDGITGVPGIGPKTASELIRQYGSLESLLTNLEGIAQKRRRELLQAHREDARRAFQLVTLRTDVDVSLDGDDFTFPKLLSQEGKRRIVDFCEAQNFTGLQKRFSEAGSQGEEALPPLDIQWVQTPEEWTTFLQQALGRLTFLQKFSPAKSRSRQKAEEEGFIAVLKGEGSEERSFTVILQSAELPLERLSADLYELAQRHSFAVDDLKSLAHVLNWPEVPSGLKDISLEAYLAKGPGVRAPLTHISSRPWKGLDKWPSQERASLEAALHEAQAVLALQDDVEEHMADPLKKLYDTLDRPFLPAVYHMERRGIFVSVKRLEELKHELDEQLASLQSDIFQWIPESFNLASPQQLGQVLSEQLGISTPVHRKTGHYQTDVQTLTQLAQERDHPVLPLLLEWRKVFKLRTTYTDTLISSVDPKTSRIHSTFLVTNTNTGRLASQNPNLQNIPIRTAEGGRIREAFEGEGDLYLASFDYSQIELRLLAYMGHVQHLIQAFENHEDIHQATAEKIFGKSPQTVTPDLRRMAKAVNFGILYGQTAYGLAQQLSLTPQEARTIIEFYFQSYPEIPAYIDRCKAQAYDKGYVETLWGRRCYLPSLRSPYAPQRQFAERQAVNAPLQGTNADIMKKAMILLEEQLRGSSVRSVLQIHDELVFEGPKDELVNLAPTIKNTMESILSEQAGGAIPLAVNVQMGKTWFEAHG